MLLLCKHLFSKALRNSSNLNHLIFRQLLLQLVAISESLNEGKGQLARANYKLSVLYTEKGMVAESEVYKTKALEGRALLRPELTNAPFEEAEFMKLCPWMLW